VLSVEVGRLLPNGVSVGPVADCEVGMADPVEGLGFAEGVVAGVIQLRYLLEVLDSENGVATPVGVVGKTVQDIGFAFVVVQPPVGDERGLAGGVRPVVVAQLGGTPADRVESLRLPGWDVELLEQAQGLLAVGHGQLVLSTPEARLSERVVSVGLMGEVAGALSESQRQL